VSMKGWGHIV